MSLGPAVDLTVALKRSVRNRIYRVGVELEGGWEELPEGIRDIARDGSVKVSKPLSQKHQERYKVLSDKSNQGIVLSTTELNEYKKLYVLINKNNSLNVGEIPSPVLDLDPKSPLYWQKWLKRHYPSHVNATCGMHVHLSMPPKRTIRYSRLMTPAYGASVIYEFKQWAADRNLPPEHPLWDRVNGKCEYCQHTFWAEEQSKRPDKDFDHHRPANRYSVINYCYTRLGTLECRLLPMFETAELATEAIEYLLKVTNAFLLTTGGQREEKIEASFIIDDDHYREEMVECA